MMSDNLKIKVIFKSVLRGVGPQTRGYWYVGRKRNVETRNDLQELMF